MSSTEENGNASALRAPGNPASGPSDVQHTKGPWHYVNGSIYANPDGKCLVGFSSSIRGDVTDRRSFVEEEANARLIASAPCLLEALQSAARHIEHMAAWITKQNAGYSFESLGEDMPDIRAALTKAGV